MGCDIHICCEVLDDNGKWRNVDHFKVNKYYNKNDVYSSEPKWLHIPVYDGRNYVLFGILAGVRDLSNQVIKQPKGFPNDASKQTKKEYNYWGVDAHTPSYLTLKEILDYNNERKDIIYNGMVDPTTAKQLDEDGIKPTSWCKSTNNQSWVYREWIDDSPLDGFIECILKLFDEEFLVYDFLNDEEKQKRRNAYKDKCRIVFWFDN